MILESGAAAMMKRFIMQEKKVKAMELIEKMVQEERNGQLRLAV